MEEQTVNVQPAQFITAVKIPAAEAERQLAVQHNKKLSVSQIAALGTGFQPVANALKQVTGKGGGSGFYYAKVSNGAHLAKFKNSARGYLGTEVVDGIGVSGQANLYPVLCNPALLVTAAVVADIDKKLESVVEMQKEMLDFLTQKEKSSLKGDLDFLLEIYNNYKYNWDSEKYKSANHIKVLDIRQHSTQMMDFYREKIQKRLNKGTGIHSDKDLQKQLEGVNADFGDYQLALYLYGFGYFLEVLLQENFEAEYLDAVCAKISIAWESYEELYKNSYEQIESYGKTSVQSKFLNGLSAFNKTVGGAIAKIPVISKTQADETLIGAGEKIGEYNEKRVVDAMGKFVERQSGCVRPFIENIESINQLYNKSSTLIFNDDNVYICSESDVNS